MCRCTVPFRVGWPEIRQVSYRLIDNRAGAARIPNRSVHLSSASVWTFLIVLTSVANSTVARNQRNVLAISSRVVLIRKGGREICLFEYSSLRVIRTFRTRCNKISLFIELFFGKNRLWNYDFIILFLPIKKYSLLNKIVGFIFLIVDFNYIPLK